MVVILQEVKDRQARCAEPPATSVAETHDLADGRRKERSVVVKKGDRARRSSKSPRFRAQRRRSGDMSAGRSGRSVISRIVRAAITKPPMVGLLPLVIAIAGAAAIGFLSVRPTEAAVIALTTSCLALLVAYVLPLLSGKKATESSMHRRFEQMEDMAWELRESEERYRTLAETFGDIVLLRDGNGQITYCNEAYVALMGGTRERIIENSILPEPVTSAVQSGQRSEVKADGSVEVCIPAGDRERWFVWLDMPMREQRTSDTGTLSVAREITAFKDAAAAQSQARKRAEEATRAKNRFLAMVSHEMRTPLNGILGMSRLLAETRLDGEQANYVKALSQSGKSLLGLINDMLDMTMIEAGRFSLNNRKFSPAEKIRETGELLAQKAHEEGIELAVHISPEFPETLDCDPDRFRQVLTNLIGNAVKYTKSGGVAVRGGVTREEDGIVLLSVTISDTGPGIGEDDAKRIFAEFERLDNEATRAVDGAGLGLAIASALAQQLGGQIRLDSTGNKGSVFAFELPFDETQSLKKERTKQDGLPKAVLIVSKNTIEASIIAAMLADFDIHSRMITDESSLDEILAERPEQTGSVLFDPQNWENVESVQERLINHAENIGRLVMLIKPGDDKALKLGGREHAVAWLTRPVRVESLENILAGKMGASAKPVVKAEGEPSENPADVIRLMDGRARVLLAEDNDINALLVTSSLKKMGVSVDRASDGKEAVSMFAARIGQSPSTPYRLVLMDMQMPVMDGLAAIERIREVEQQSAVATPVNIQVLSADEQENTRHDALKRGANEFLLKPIDPSILGEIVVKAIEQ